MHLRAHQPSHLACQTWSKSFLVVLVLGWPTSGVAQQTVTSRDLVPAPDSLGQPLGLTRTIRFRTTEGTWMSVDVSPDGATIVFDLLGDLYALPINGGTARPLTWGMAFDAQPRFSPNGREIAFISDRSGVPNLWIVDRDGRTPRQISNLHNLAMGTTICSPVWAPDGRTIVVSQRLGAVRPAPDAPPDSNYWHSSHWLLAAYDVPSGRMRWITDTSYARARGTLGIAFGSDSMTVYAAAEPHRTTYSDRSAWRIERVDLRTGAFIPEMSPGLGRDGLRPRVSPNGRWLVYVSNTGAGHGFRLRSLATGHERWLVEERLAVTDESFGLVASRDLVPGYAFTPDSRSLIAAYGGKIHQIHLASGRASTIPFVVHVERTVAPLTVHQFALPDTATRTRRVLQPALSPEGTAVAFSALNRLWVMDLPHDGQPGGLPRRLTTDSVGESYPYWSPDGAWIAYSTWQDGEGGAVRRAWVRPAADGTPAPSERLTTDRALYFNTAAAPGGDRIVAVRATLPSERVLTHTMASPATDVELLSIPVAVGRATPLPLALPQGGSGTSRLPVEQVYFTADPTRVYVGLTSVALDGADRRVTLAARQTTFSRDMTGVVSPDRRRAWLDEGYALFEVTLAAPDTCGVDTLDFPAAQARAFGALDGAARRWGRALSAWISWSRDGRRVIFSQGGTLFVGDVRPDEWTRFTRVDVPLTVPVDIPQGTLVLRGARLITMRERSDRRPEVIEDGDLVIRNNRIVAVGRRGTVPIPPGARTRVLRGKTILPGYVDVHDHLGTTYGVHSDQCWMCLVRLAAGVTTSRSALDHEQTDSYLFALSERERAGAIVSPRIFTTGVANYGGDRPIQTMDDARAVVEPIADYFGGETFKEYDGEAARQARQLVANAAAGSGLNSTIHIIEIPWGITAFTDGFTGVEHAPSNAIPLYDDVLTFIARSGVTHTLTYGTTLSGSEYMVSQPRTSRDLARLRRFVPPSARNAWALVLVRIRKKADWANLSLLLTSAAGIVARGGRVALGSHGDIGGYSFHYEMWLHALGGMPSHEILRSATMVGAAAIGHANDFGSLEPGKLADLQILDRNPLDDIHYTVSTRYVMKNGRLYDAKSLTEIWPRHKPLGPLYLYDGTDLVHH